MAGWWFGTFFIFPYWECHNPNSYFSEGLVNHQPEMNRMLLYNSDNHVNHKCYYIHVTIDMLLIKQRYPAY